MRPARRRRYALSQSTPPRGFSLQQEWFVFSSRRSGVRLTPELSQAAKRRHWNEPLDASPINVR